MTIRRLSEVELHHILDWAAQEGWNPGHDDASAFYAADPEGFFVVDHKGAPAAALSVVNHSSEFASLGLYICRPEHRGKGFGLRLWQRGLEHAGRRTVGLDGPPAYRPKYQRSGFVHAGRTHRYEGRLPLGEISGTRPAVAADLARLEEIDRAATDVRRPAFLRAWLAATDARRTFVLERAGDVVGFATARRCRAGIKIGPLAAPDADGAATLVKTAAAAFSEPHVIIDIPDSATDGSSLVRAFHLTRSFSTDRMYRGTPPKAAETLYGVATLELG